MNEKLYYKGYSFPNLKCITVEEGEAIVGEIHEEVCGNHSGSRLLAHKALRTRFFWPNMSAMVDKISARCHKCHLNAMAYCLVNSTVAMAFCTVRLGSNREVVHGPKATQVRNSGRWLLLEVGGGGALEKDNHRVCVELFDEEHLLQIWGPGDDRQGQRDTIQQQPLDQVHRENGHQNGLRICGAPIDQRACGNNYQNYQKAFEEEVR